MNENGKPFACTAKGCQMTFTNEDHWNWHHKKHDMVLSLEVTGKNSEVADQTPTPTRFIRNCEEVGLFQDLLIVNPFDETFKKAIESARGGTLHVPEASSSDDTLHTPHILPHVEANANKYLSGGGNANHSNPPSGFCINNLTSNDDDSKSNDNIDLTIDLDDSDEEQEKNNKQLNLKDKLKETIQNKAKSPAVITPVPLEKLMVNNNEAPNKRKIAPRNVVDNANKKPRIDPKQIEIDEKEKTREMNRAAQIRCRKRKQYLWAKMEEEVKTFKTENMKLSTENQIFKQKFYALKELLLKHKNDSDIRNSIFVHKVEQLLNSSTCRMIAPAPNVRPKPKPSPKKQVSLSPLVPVAMVENPGKEQKPVVIKVMGSVQQLALSVLPHK